MSDLHPLKDLLDFTRDGEWGKGGPGSDLVEMAVIRGTDFASVRRGDISTVPRRFIPEGAADRKALMPGDLLIETAGGTKDQPTGRTVYLSERIFDALPVPVTCASFSRFLRVNRELVNPRYLFWYLQSIYSTGEMLPYHIQHTGVARFQYTDFASQWLVPVPPLDKQAKIAETLSVFDDKIALNRRMNETLEAMARALFKDWFVDFGPTRAKIEGRDPYLAPEIWDLFPDKLDEDGKPEGWETQSVIDQAEWVNGAAYGNMHFSNAHDALPVVKIAELKAGVTKNTKRTNTELGDKYRIRDRELLFSWSGNPDTSIDTFIWTGGEAWLNQHIFAVRDNGARTPAFLYTMLKWLKPEFAEIARNKQTTGLGHVTKQDLKRMQIYVGPRELLEESEHLIGPLHARMQTNLVENMTLAQARDLLLPKLMSGEIRVGDTDKIVLEST